MTYYYKKLENKKQFGEIMSWDKKADVEFSDVFNLFVSLLINWVKLEKSQIIKWSSVSYAGNWIARLPAAKQVRGSNLGTACILQWLFALHSY